MICRQCPACDTNWYSARTTPWLCEKCGTELTDEHNKRLQRDVSAEGGTVDGNSGTEMLADAPPVE